MHVILRLFVRSKLILRLFLECQIDFAVFFECQIYFAAFLECKIDFAKPSFQIDFATMVYNEPIQGENTASSSTH